MRRVNDLQVVVIEASKQAQEPDVVKRQLDQAEELVLARLKDLEEQPTNSVDSREPRGSGDRRAVPVPAGVIGGIIGHKGSTVAELRAKTGLRIDVLPPREDSFGRVLIGPGDTEAIDRAEELVAAKVRELEAGQAKRAARREEAAVVPVAAASQWEETSSGWSAPNDRRSGGNEWSDWKDGWRTSNEWNDAGWANNGNTWGSSETRWARNEDQSRMDAPDSENSPSNRSATDAAKGDQKYHRCGDCGAMSKHGFIDEGDGNWYCEICWQSFDVKKDAEILDIASKPKSATAGQRRKIVATSQPRGRRDRAPLGMHDRPDDVRAEPRRPFGCAEIPTQAINPQTRDYREDGTEPVPKNPFGKTTQRR